MPDLMSLPRTRYGGIQPINPRRSRVRRYGAIPNFLNTDDR